MPDSPVDAHVCPEAPAGTSGAAVATSVPGAGSSSVAILTATEANLLNKTQDSRLGCHCLMSLRAAGSNHIACPSLQSVARQQCLH